MRQVAKKIGSAWMAGKSAKAGNTKTDGTTVWLHGNAIAWKGKDRIAISLAGWNTPTTRSRLNDLLREAGVNAGLHCKDGVPYLSFHTSWGSESAKIVMPTGSSHWIDIVHK